MNTTTAPLTSDQLLKVDACWSAANCLPVGQIYLDDKLIVFAIHRYPRMVHHRTKQ